VQKDSIGFVMGVVAAIPFVAVLASGCEKSASSSGGTTNATAEPSGTGTSMPIATTPASMASSATPVASSAATRAAASDSAVPTAAVDAGKGKDSGPATVKTATARVDGKNFGLDLASPGCKVDADCAMTIRLVAAGDWHINKDYPYKFIANAAPGVTFLGKSEANVFGKPTGDFHEEGEKSATMTVRFKPTSAGEAKVSGTYKLSVCSAEQCQIEQQAVRLSVPVM